MYSICTSNSNFNLSSFPKIDSYWLIFATSMSPVDLIWSIKLHEFRGELMNQQVFPTSKHLRVLWDPGKRDAKRVDAQSWWLIHGGGRRKKRCTEVVVVVSIWDCSFSHS